MDNSKSWRADGKIEVVGYLCGGRSRDERLRERFDLSGALIAFFLSPLWGLLIVPFAYPRLAPWAVFFRRFAAGLVECPTFCAS